jgi:hypothetical protein
MTTPLPRHPVAEEVRRADLAYRAALLGVVGLARLGVGGPLMNLAVDARSEAERHLIGLILRLHGLDAGHLPAGWPACAVALGGYLYGVAQDPGCDEPRPRLFILDGRPLALD